MTPEEAIEILREQHTPYIPEIVSVSEDGENWREPTLEDKAASLEWWCDGCNRLASLCQVMPILDLVGVDLDPGSCTN